jgi:acetyl-CoA synthetase
VAKEIGPIAKPRARSASPNALPKTRSGKIMRRLLRDIASGRAVGGDTTTLEDQAVLERLAQSHAGDE